MENTESESLKFPTKCGDEVKKQESFCEDSDSENGLQIVLDTPRSKKRQPKPLDTVDHEIIACVEKDFEETLEEKATKANLNSKHVKNILKHVVTNEEFLTLVRLTENPEECQETLTYEPKYTRAKTKQLLSSNIPAPIIAWVAPPKLPKPPPDVQVLLNGELPEEDDSGEYIPKEVPEPYADDDEDLDTSTSKTIEGEDGAPAETEEATIALRTRSKLCLNNTPLEEIEEAFIPPDITADDLDHDDLEWKDFLKTLEQPLEDVVKALEEEEHDPEYNILADEDNDEVDREELRADRAVTVSRRELNDLMAELFEYTDIYESNKLQDNKDNNDVPPPQEIIIQILDPDDDPNVSIKKSQLPLLAQQIRQHVQMLTQNFLLTYQHAEFDQYAIDCKNKLVTFWNESVDNSYSMFNAVNLAPAIKLIEYWQNLFATESKEVLETKAHMDRVCTEAIQAKQVDSRYTPTFPPLVMETITKSNVFLYTNLLPKIPFKPKVVTELKYVFFSTTEEHLIASYLHRKISEVENDPYFQFDGKVNMTKVVKLLHADLMVQSTVNKLEDLIIRRKNDKADSSPIKFYFDHKTTMPIVHYVIPLEVLKVLPPCERNLQMLPLLWRMYLYEKDYKPPDIINWNIADKKFVLISSTSASPLKISKPLVTAQEFVYARKVINNKRTVLTPKGLVPLLSVPKRRVRKSRTSKTVCKVDEEEQKKNHGHPNESVSVDGLPENKENRLNTRQPLDKDDEDPLDDLKTNSNSALADFYNTFRTEVEAEEMLPDMPSLGVTPVKEQAQPSNVETQEGKKESSSEPVEQNISGGSQEPLSFKNITSFESCFKAQGVKRNFQVLSEFSMTTTPCESDKDKVEKDNPNDITDLMKAITNVKSTPKKEPSGAEKKRAKTRREFLANLTMSSPPNPEYTRQREMEFVAMYYDKLQEELEPEDYNKVMEHLNYFEESSEEFDDFYRKVQRVLSPKYEALATEFLLFLTEQQAHRHGKLLPYFLMKDMKRFYVKLDLYFKEQPLQLRKILKTLRELPDHSNLTKELIRNTVVPLLRGNTALLQWFFQIFPDERTPDILANGPCDFIDLKKELERSPDEEIFETVIVPETEDPYGGANCICQCHSNSDSTQDTAKLSHCNKCGLKFMHGKIYLQTGKSLRPAAVTFLTNPKTDHSKRLCPAQRKRADSSPSKHGTSPHKDHQHENSKKQSDGSDKSQRKRKTKAGDKSGRKTNKKTDKTSKANCPKASGSGKCSTKKNATTRKSNPSTPTGTSSSTKKRQSKQSRGQKRQAEESPEVVPQCRETMAETESGSGCVPDSSTDSGESWTRDEDKIILQRVQQMGDNDETFEHISSILSFRSVLDIRNRFYNLMSLLQEMASSSSK